jgi:hypothetical protein
MDAAVPNVLAIFTPAPRSRSSLTTASTLL